MCPHHSSRVALIILLSSVLLAVSAMTLCGQLAQAAILKIGITSTYAPYHYINPSGRPSGIHFDIISEAFKEQKLDIKLIVVPRKRLEAAVLAGEIDAFLNALEWTDGIDRFVYSDPLSVIQDVVYWRVNKPVLYKKPSDLIGKTAIAIRGYHYPPLDRQFANGDTTRHDVKDELHALKMLDAERGDVALVVEEVGDWIIAREKFVNKFEKSSVPLTTAQFRLILGRKWQQRLEGFNRNLTRMRESGKLESIRRDHL